MRLSRGLSLGWRLGIGLVLAGALFFVTRYVDWQSPTDARLGPLGMPLLGLIAILSALLIQSFSRRFNVFEVFVNTAIVFVLGCLLLPPVVPDHSRLGNQPASAVRPVISRP